MLWHGKDTRTCGKGRFWSCMEVASVLLLYRVPRPIPWISKRGKGRQSSHVVSSCINRTNVRLNTYGNHVTLNGKQITQNIYYILENKSLPYRVRAERLNKQNRIETGFYKTSSIKSDVRVRRRRVDTDLPLNRSALQSLAPVCW